jgi:hypothetical protein
MPLKFRTSASKKRLPVLVYSRHLIQPEQALRLFGGRRIFGLMRGRKAPSFGSPMPAAGTAVRSQRLSGKNGNENGRRLEEEIV